MLTIDTMVTLDAKFEFSLDLHFHVNEALQRYLTTFEFRNTYFMLNGVYRILIICSMNNVLQICLKISKMCLGIFAACVESRGAKFSLEGSLGAEFSLDVGLYLDGRNLSLFTSNKQVILYLEKINSNK
jgi:hypothetical protein